MFEKLKEKLKKIFAEKGIDEGTTEEVLVELDREEEEPKPEEQEPAPIQEETTEEVAVEDMPKPEEDEVALPEEEPAPEAVPVPEEQPVEEPREIVEQPQFDYDGLKADLDETKKTNDALLARVESLEEALRAAGVIDGEKPQKPYGVDKPSAPAKDPLDDDLDGFFAKVNRKSF